VQGPKVVGVWEAAIASKLAPTGGCMSITKSGSTPILWEQPVDARLLAMNDDAVYLQNSRVLDTDTCRESPMDTKNRLAAEV
jgi:hypothetical protein